MKKNFFVLYFSLLLISCRKDTAPDQLPAPLPATLLEQYNWQSVSLHEEKFPLDTSQLISYRDTTLYTFRDKTFTRKMQFTVARFVFGSSRPYFILQQDSSVRNGQYSVSPVDSTLQLTYLAKTDSYSPRDLPGRDTVVTEVYKIMTLNNQMLEVTPKPAKPGAIPPFPFLQSFFAVPK